MNNNPHINEFGSKFWKNHKEKLHRIDGPAYESVNGEKQWRVNGELHRVDGPAIERANGTKIWYIYGKCYRLDGPTIEYASRSKYWYVDYYNISSINNFYLLLVR